jgi:hypothetical protein
MRSLCRAWSSWTTRANREEPHWQARTVSETRSTSSERLRASSRNDEFVSDRSECRSAVAEGADLGVEVLRRSVSAAVGGLAFDDRKRDLDEFRQRGVRGVGGIMGSPPLARGRPQGHASLVAAAPVH